MQTVNSNLFVGGPKDGQTIPIEDHLNMVEIPLKVNPDGRSWCLTAYKRMAFRVGDAEIQYWAWTGMESSQIKITFFATDEEVKSEAEPTGIERFVKQVKAGETIEDFVAPNDGWIWFDEAGLLGSEMVYPSKEMAVEAINDYAFYLRGGEEECG